MNNNLVDDKENEVPNDNWPVDCNKCNLSLDSLENFNQHMNDHWSEDKCCPVCGILINSTRSNFKQHLKTHTSVKPFVCEFCKKSFRKKDSMEEHRRIHTGEKPFVCEICTREAIQYIF